MMTLGIESSCDECSAAILHDGELLSHEIASQIPIHQKYGGVVPELASRAHILDIIEVLDLAFENAGISHRDIDNVAVTQGPGLIGSLLVGIEAAKAFAYANDKPLIGVHHTEGHLLAPLLSTDERYPAPQLPFMGLVVSGGHTNLIRVNGIGDYTHVGETLDDAAGEALDKIGKALGLSYPGGVAIDKISVGGNATAFDLPRPLKNRNNFDFSFSGLKTAALTQLRKIGELPTGELLADFCASTLEAVVDSLVSKTIRAAIAYQTPSVVVTGGVSANRRLRERFELACREADLMLSIPPLQLCTDNAAMIAQLGALKFLQRKRNENADKIYGFDAFDLAPHPSWRIV